MGRSSPAMPEVCGFAEAARLSRPQSRNGVDHAEHLTVFGLLRLLGVVEQVKWLAWIGRRWTPHHRQITGGMRPNTPPEVERDECVHAGDPMKKPADLHRAGFGDTDSDYRIEADFRPMCTGLSTTILYGFFRTRLPRQLSCISWAYSCASVRRFQSARESVVSRIPLLCVFRANRERALSSSSLTPVLAFRSLVAYAKGTGFHLTS